MLTKIRLTNFRAFDEHEVSFKKLNVIVGQNNAGKSSLVDALRIISLCASRVGRSNFADSPTWADLPKIRKGVVASSSTLDINFDSIVYRNRSSYCKINAYFSSNYSLEIYVNNEGRIFFLVKDAEDSEFVSKARLTTLTPESVAVLPEIAPLKKNEEILTENHIRENFYTRLSPNHFRNQLFLLENDFAEFKKVSEETWKGLQIQEIGVSEDRKLYLLVRDAGFATEIWNMGHGLQTWLQATWFLSRSGSMNTIILDEPDVYLHADLQRKLMRLLKRKSSQVIVATHSVEIMSEVDHSDVIVLNKSNRRSNFASNQVAAQNIIDSIGSVHNLHLARIAHSKRFIFLEGNDLPYLKAFQDAIDPESNTPIDTIPNKSIGGWSGWQLVHGSSLIIPDEAKTEILLYCILDSDYHTDEEIAERLREAKTRGISLHIWSRKEIENYLLCPSAISRTIKPRRNADKLNAEWIKEEIEKITSAMKYEIIDNYANEIRKQTKSSNIQIPNKKAREIYGPRLDNYNGQIARASGKEVLSKLQTACREQFGQTFSTLAIAKNMTAREVPDEVKKVILAMSNREKF